MKPTYIIKTRTQDPELVNIATQIAQTGMPSGADVIYDERNRLFRIYIGGRPYIVKAFRRPNAINSVAYTTVRQSKAARSYLNAMRLESIGFNTPRPVAYMEVRYGLRLHESYYISADVAAPQIRHWERRADADPLLSAFASDMVRLHAAGVWHKDFSPGNVLVEGDAVSGYKFWYIDLNRMKFNVHNPHTLLSMFGRMHEAEEPLRSLARHYVNALIEAQRAGSSIPKGIDPNRVEEEAVEAFRLFWAKQERKQRLKARLRSKKGS